MFLEGKYHILNAATCGYGGLISIVVPNLVVNPMHIEGANVNFGVLMYTKIQ